MKYRGFKDREISALGAILIIAIVGSIATLSIVHVISTINFAYQTQAAALGI